MDTEEGQIFIKNLAYFVRTHERALANALQLRRQNSKNGRPSDARPGSPPSSARPGTSPLPHPTASLPTSTSSVLAAALSLPSLTFGTQSNVKPAKLSLTPHHLFYLLSRFEELGIPVGPMNVRLESIHAEASSGNYVSFLSQSQRSHKGRLASDRDSVHSVASVPGLFSGMSFLLSSLGVGASVSAARVEKTKAALQADLKYLYSAFTKIPCLRLAPDRKARLIAGYEEFPFDTAVPLWAFKNLSALEICDVDVRQFFGWDRMADQLRSLTVRRAGVEDPADLLINLVLDDMDKRRRRSSKSQPSPHVGWAASSPFFPHADLAATAAVAAASHSAPGSPKADSKPLAQSASPQSVPMSRGAGSEGSRILPRPRPRSRSPSQPSLARLGSSHGHVRGGVGGHRMKRSGSGSSTSSTHSTAVYPSGSSSNLLATLPLPPTKWRFLKHLSLADNALTSLTAAGLAPLANTLYSLDLSGNLFAQIPDCLATLTSLRALNLSHCMIESLHSLSRNPLPAITALNLRANRLGSIAGIERLPSLERVDLRDNKLTDPTEMARLTGIPEIHEVWLADNPFTKTHPRHRISIFNLFRETAGYREDILIDGSGPTYQEKKLLVERTAEPPTLPVVTAPPVEPEPSRAVTPEPALSTAARHRSPSDPQAPGSPTERAVEGGMGVRPHPVSSRSHRRQRGPRRRIVELSRSDIHSSPESPFASPTGDVDPYFTRRRTSVVGVPRPSPPVISSDGLLPDLTSPPQPPDPLSVDTSAARPLVDAPLTAPVAHHSTPEAPDWNVSSELYRKKIEALKHEVGNGWLSVLSEGTWDGPRSSSIASPVGDFNPVGTLRPSPPTPTASSPAIMSGGRMLG